MVEHLAAAIDASGADDQTADALLYCHLLAGFQVAFKVGPLELGRILVSTIDDPHLNDSLGDFAGGFGVLNEL